MKDRKKLKLGAVNGCEGKDSRMKKSSLRVARESIDDLAISINTEEYVCMYVCMYDAYVIRENSLISTAKHCWAVRFS